MLKGYKIRGNTKIGNWELLFTLHTAQEQGD